MSLAPVSPHAPHTRHAAPSSAAAPSPIPAQRTPQRTPGQPPAREAAPSSLVKIPEAARRRCPACGSARLTEIVMTLTDGTPVQFTSCRHCEHRSWTTDDEVLPVESVLTKATKRK